MMQSAKGKAKGPRMIHEIRRLKKMGLSQRKIASALGISRNTVIKYLNVNAKDPGASAPYSAPWADEIDWKQVKSETEQGVCLAHYWEESLQVADGSPRMPYVSFWREFKRRYPDIPIDFHKTHPPGERCEVDFKGKTKGIGYTCPETGDFVQCRLFGAILCFSQLTFVRATPNENQLSFLSSIAKSYEYFGGVTQTTAVDNAKAQVTKAHRYDADLNPEFFNFSNHYNTAPLAMRPKHPKDKNLVENVLGVFWRWARPKVRKRRPRSLGELNECLLELLERFNDRLQRKSGQSRRQKFLAGEKDKLQPLPKTSYEGGSWKQSKVHPDSHIQLERNFYSIPHRFVGKSVDVRVTGSNIEAFYELERIAIHQRRHPTQRGCYTTDDSHLPEKHLAVKSQTPQHLIDQAEDIGVATLQVIKSLLISNDHHPFTYLRRCQGILRLSTRYSSTDLEQACETILSLHPESPRLRDIEGIISYNRAGKKRKAVSRQPNTNLRGQDHWRNTIH